MEFLTILVVLVVVVAVWIFIARQGDAEFDFIVGHIPRGTGGTVVITVTFTAKEGSIREALGQMHELTVDMGIDIVYQIVARTSWYIHKARMIMTCDEIMRAMHEKSTANRRRPNVRT